MNLLREIMPFATPEEEFILCYARTGMAGSAHARIERLTSEPLNWRRIDELAARHRIRPLLFKHIKMQAKRPAIPAPIWKQIQRHALFTVGRNLAQTVELIRIIKLLRAENIQAIPFKGPVMASRVYGNLALREFFDLDLLVHCEDLLRAKFLLAHHGYTSPPTQNNAHEAEHIDAQSNCYFLSPDGNTRLELHCSFMQKWLGYGVDLEGVWKRASWIDVMDEPVRAMAREDLLPYLCAHGAKHHWERLFWIMDIAEFIRAENDMDWNALLAAAERDGNWRVVALGLYLAYGLLDAPLPRDTVKNVSTPQIRQLARAVGNWLFNEELRPATGDLEETRFYLKSKERVSHRLGYTTHLVKQAVAPSDEDRKFIKLPQPLKFLYPAIRPIRWLVRSSGFSPRGSRSNKPVD